MNEEILNWYLAMNELDIIIIIINVGIVLKEPL